ncbi:MAG: beta-ketoacyl-[acyl-carrier-protein] synthase family protein [Candidatus Omnitrophica bacterium]|jgi:3-oxoacyl-(acyl-carrier-protein) synthase|nr:beta-ketoacyl-[acyl-carrier-protein] synthase family protein [Candidatus Omnitrophota bacterium]
MKTIAVTGIGVVTPSGIGRRQFWANIKAGRSFVREITRFDASKYPSRIAGQIDDLDKYSRVSERLLKKIDAFSHMALVASELALQEAGIDIKKEDPDRVGIFLGNAIGGWLYAETELRDLYIEGRQGVSPYMASAWFPAAPQGQVSIYYGIKGFSKTVVADRAGSLMAVGYARKTLLKEKLDLILAGGMEAPVTPYALLCCNTYGGLCTENSDPAAAYRPFDRSRAGFVVGEGAAIMVMEDLERARDRGAALMGKITGYGTSCDGVDRINPDRSGRQLARAVKNALDEAGAAPEDIDYISLDGMADDVWDYGEADAIKMVFGERAGDVPVSCPKSMFGNLLGASGALDVIIALLAMEHSLIPPTLNLRDPDPVWLNYVKDKALERRVDKALVISRGRGGINSALVVEKA